MSTPKILDRDRWSTPPALIDGVSEFMGSRPAIDLAANASNKVSDSWVGEQELTLTRDSYTLTQPLMRGLLSVDPTGIAGIIGDGWAWLNPPYSRGNMARFTAWAAAYVEAGGTVALCSRPDMSTTWYQQNVLPHASRILAPETRVHFIPPPGLDGDGPAFAAIVTIMRAGNGRAVQPVAWRVEEWPT